MLKPLTGLKVLELAGLAPVPFCGRILADFGASVTVVDVRFLLIVYFKFYSELKTI